MAFGKNSRRQLFIKIEILLNEIKKTIHMKMGMFRINSERSIMINI